MHVYKKSLYFLEWNLKLNRVDGWFDWFLLFTRWVTFKYLHVLIFFWSFSPFGSIYILPFVSYDFGFSCLVLFVSIGFQRSKKWVIVASCMWGFWIFSSAVIFLPFQSCTVGFALIKHNPFGKFWDCLFWFSNFLSKKRLIFFFLLNCSCQLKNFKIWE